MLSTAIRPPFCTLIRPARKKDIRTEPETATNFSFYISWEAQMKEAALEAESTTLAKKTDSSLYYSS
jgi:hypothetical protein